MTQKYMNKSDKFENTLDTKTCCAMSLKLHEYKYQFDRIGGSGSKLAYGVASLQIR